MTFDYDSYIESVTSFIKINRKIVNIIKSFIVKKKKKKK